MRKNLLFPILIVILIAAIGCSGGGNPAVPQDTPAVEKSASAINTHQCWGYWQFTCDPAAGTVDVAQLRGADLHLNAMKFLEPPALLYLTLESAPVFSGGVLDIDIGIRHPFLGLTQYTGFDVCGILISHGSISGFASDAALNLPGDGDTRLLNADGFTRWWNPTEFPPNETAPIQGYKDGILGTPDSEADFDATLNGYKYFTDDLDPSAPLSDVDLQSRGKFGAGMQNIRHYKFDLGDSFIFNYAVDANWAFPAGTPPYDIPGDFPEKANRPEAWRVDVHEIDNTLAYKDGIPSGHLLMDIDVYDWFDADLNQVVVESKGNIAPVTASVPSDGGAGYSTYELDLPGDGLATAGTIDLLITVRSDAGGYQGILPGEAVSAYFIYPAEVGNITEVDDYIDLGFTRLEEFPDTPDSSIANCHMYRSADSGGTFYYAWKGNATHYLQVLKSLKSTDDPLGYTTFIYQSWTDWGQTAFQHASTARDPSCPGAENEGIYIPWGAHSNEVMWGGDNIALCFGDGLMQITYKKGTDPFSLYYNHGWTDWVSAPEPVIVESPAQLGVTRCMVKDNAGRIHFAYFGGPDGVWIKLATNEDGLGTSWNIDTYINEGITDEYEARIEPSLAVDYEGVFHSTFIGVIGDTHALLYTHADDYTDWPGYNAIYTSDDGWLGEATVDVFQDLNGNKVIVISFEMDGDIWMLYSLDFGESFSEPVLISDGTGNSTEPDIYADAQGYVHFAWSEFDEDLPLVDDYDIHYRRAYMDETGWIFGGEKTIEDSIHMDRTPSLNQVIITE